MSDQPTPTRLMDLIQTPTDLRKFQEADLRHVCEEIREILIDAVSKTGGHLGAGLGTVELAVALHYAFQTPQDKIIWDVGHQAYPHKILTGRKERIHTLRQFKGISGFLKRDESEYDVFGAGHASTSISAALGVACARDAKQEKNSVIAVIGDGAMTGGLAYEAMNNCGLSRRNLIVVFNDNNMSISENKWVVSNYFNDLIASPAYNRLRANVWDLAGKFDELGDRFRRVTSRIEGGLKSILTPGMLFEALGFRYFGPVSGHNVVRLVRLFREVRELPGPILIHVITQKGKGYKPAEEDQMNLHGVTPFDRRTGKPPVSTAPASYTSIFGNALVELADEDERIMGITAAMDTGTGMDIFHRAHPKRYHDVGIAEQHAVTFAAGLATEGCIPVVAIYSTFLQRAFDQIIHDVALQHLHVVFAIDRAGLVGADGPTHHGSFDLTYMRMIPDMVIMAPRDDQELRNMLHTAIHDCPGPVAVRYPRGNASGMRLAPGFTSVPIGRSVTLRDGSDLTILAIGTMVDHAMKAAGILDAEGIHARVVDMRFIKPLDAELLRTLAGEGRPVFTVEDNTIVGGFGGAVVEHSAQQGWGGLPIRMFGLPDAFVEHGTQAELHAMLELDGSGLARRIASAMHHSMPVQDSQETIDAGHSHR